MKKIIFSFMLLAVLTLNTVWAHNMWIETAAQGKVGKEHKVRVFLGGYGENERDSTTRWFANTKEVVLWLTEPDGSKKQLQTSAAADYMEAAFTPSQDGVYTVSFSHDLQEVYGTRLYQYHGVAQVQVGSSKTGSANLATTNNLNTQIATAKPVVSKPLTLKVQFKGQHPEKSNIVICSPAGWVKELEPENGLVTFDPIWPGLYVGELNYREKAEGSVGEKKYTEINHIATYSFTITK
jgi:hypothetical protein